MDRGKALIEAVVELDEQGALRLVDELVAAGASNSVIVQAACTALQIVGERYERQEYFLSALIVAGEIFKSVVDLVKPELWNDRSGIVTGKVLLGTVEGDIHDLGKNIAGMALTGLGFTVRDLGVDVPASRFVEEARGFCPDILGLSGILVPVAARSMRETVEAIRADRTAEEGPLFVIIGGNVDKTIADYVGADTWTTDALEGARICQRLLESGKSRSLACSQPTA